MIKVLHIITGLAADGAERMLFDITTRMDRADIQHSVVSLTGMGELGDPLERRGISVQAIELGKGPRSLLRFWKLRRLLRNQRPDLVQTWMYHADLVGGLAAKSAGVARVLWSVHHGEANRTSMRWLTRKTAQTCARLSRWVPQRILFCSEASRRNHGQLGYAEAKATLIPNGFDTDRFRPDEDAREQTRRAWGIGANDLVIGVVARYHPHKDHATFLAAAQRIAAAHGNVRFVLCGRDVSVQNEKLWQQVESIGLADRMLALGSRNDIHRLLPGMDVLVSSSRTEAFPLAVGEAMACAVPCVVTDVGDSGLLVGETGVVVPAQDPEALAGGITRLLMMDSLARRALGRGARTRIESLYSIDSVVRRYQDLYLQISRA